MTRTFYDVLEVSADASQSAIRDAYREKVKQFHPDVCDHPDAEERFKRVKRAEEVLADPDERSTYDRVGHEQYVDGRPAASSKDASADVRAAAARAAARDDSDDAGGGRSAGWRERERRARGDPADWFKNDVGYDASGPRDVGGSDDASSQSGDGATDADARTGAQTNGSTADRRSRADRRARAARSGAAGRGHAATEAWGHREARTHTHAVHEWAAHETERTFSIPRLTQDELVLLAASILVYPILLFLAVLPAFPTVANVAIGLLAIVFVAFLLPRPAFAIPVFGTWSVGIPALLVGFEIPVLSLVGAVTLIGVWIPLCYSLAVAFVLMR